MRKPLNYITFASLLIIYGCSTPNPVVGPTSINTENTKIVAEMAIAPSIVTTPDIPVVEITPPVVNIDPPVNPGRPFNRNDCDYSNPGAIRCYNPSSTPITITGAMNSINCDQTFGKQTITIPPFTNGYFTLPRPSCGKTGQGDFYFSSNEGSCKNPDFTSQVTYNGGACAPVITTPPVTVCTPNWNNPPWLDVITAETLEIICRPQHRFLSDGCGNTREEKREVCTQG